MTSRRVPKKTTRPAGAPASANPNPPDEFIWDIVPEEQQGITVDVSGPEGIGKSHFAATFPGAIAWADTENKSDPIVRKFRKTHPDKPIMLKRAKCFNDIRAMIDYALADDSIKTIVIDSGSHLRRLAAEEWCIENNKKAVHPPTQYQWVNKKIDVEFNKIKEAGKNLVVTNRLKDEWIGDNKTGRQVRNGYANLTYDFHVVLEIKMGIPDERGIIRHKDFRFAKVRKNAFWGIDDTTNLNHGKPWMFKVDYDGVTKEILEPWGAGVKLGEEAKTIAEQAKAMVEG